jgi:hypothetical protein
MASLRRSTPTNAVDAEGVLEAAEAFEEAAAIVGEVMRKLVRGPDEVSNSLGRRLGGRGQLSEHFRSNYILNVS